LLSIARTEMKTVGDSAFRYRVQDDWAKLPDGWVFGDVGGVGVDSKDNVYVFNRSEHPMIVFDREGNFLRSWGESVFRRPHGIHIGPDDSVYCTDDGDHTVRKCRPDGKILLELGIPNRPAPFMSGLPFHRCTHTALSPRGDIYVSDGYGNARMHKYSPDGKLLFSWGESGTDPGHFNVVHNVCCDPDGWVYVADRENHRVQVFDGDGKYETQWNNLHRPCGMCMESRSKPFCYIGEAGPMIELNRDFAGLGPRLSVVTHEGKLIARIGDIGYGHASDRFIAPHGLAVDSRGDIYVGEVAKVAWPSFYPDRPPPEDLRTFRKLVKIV
jgi:DNA-binding beta-propeller fold protein YncE